MYKKLAIIFSVTLGVCLFGSAALIPLGIRDTIGGINELLLEYKVQPQTIEVKPTAEFLRFDMEYYYGDVLFLQSPDDSCYIETYCDNTLYPTPVYTTYGENDTEVVVSIERPMGKFSLDEKTLKTTIVKELQNYPDVIIYIPRRMSLEKQTSDFVPDDIQFKNKEELLNMQGA
ncbi:MAG: hypothetical protein KHZ62_08950 [Clostridiales bacterium]|nr:hypothetical protein [Clostridiales bacterium]